MATSARAYGWSYAGAATAILLLVLILPSDGPIAASVTIASEKQVESLLKVVDSMIALITTLNTAMLAAAAAVAVKGREWSSVWTPFDAVVLILVFLCGAVSYFGVYVAYVALLEMIENGGLSALAPRLQLGFALQYFGTLLGVFLLGLTFARLMAGRRAAAPKLDAKKIKED